MRTSSYVCCTLKPYVRDVIFEIVDRPKVGDAGYRRALGLAQRE